MTRPAEPTPGPWRVDPERRTRVLAIDKIPVAAVSGWAPVAEGHANARLIAAAPDMADALRRALPLAEVVLEARKRWEFSGAAKSLTDEAQSAVDVIRAALAKLEG